MKKQVKAYAGFALVAIGLLTFAASCAFRLTDVNGVQFTGLALVAAGIVAHVALLKRESKY